MGYLCRKALLERGLREVPQTRWTWNEVYKRVFADKDLSPCLHFSECGYDHASYTVMEDADGNFEEYAILYPEETDENGVYINVSGDSRAAMALDVWKCVLS